LCEKQIVTTLELISDYFLFMHWSRTITNNYLITQVLLALEEVGLWETLANHKRKTVSELAKELGVHEHQLATSMDFLWSMTDFLDKDAGYYSLREQEIRKPLIILKAYKDVFDNMGKILNGTRKYGENINRDGYYLQKASEFVTEKSINLIIGSLNGKRNLQLIDLGCGSAVSIINFCKQSGENSAIGIDIDESTVLEARKRILNENLHSQAQIILADAMDIKEWMGKIAQEKEKIFIISTLLHESLNSGERGIIQFLKQLHEKFTKTHLFILEFDTPSFEKIKNLQDQVQKNFLARYRLWHPFSNQGMPQPRAIWERIIYSAGWNVNKITKEDMDLITYECTPH